MSGFLGGAPPRFTRYRPNRWYGTSLRGFTAASNQAVAANLAYAFPLPIDGASVAEIAMAVGTAVPGTNARLAFYTCHPTQPVPENLIFGSLVNNDMNAAAGTIYGLVLPGPVYVAGDVVFGVAKFDGAAQPRVVSNAAAAAIGGVNDFLTNFLGATGAAQVTGAHTTGNMTRLTAPAPFADPWPARWTPDQWTLGAHFPGSPIFGWRAA